MLLGVLVTAAPTASGHYESGALGIKGMSESELQKAETVMLGPEHAAEHALERQLAEEGELQATDAPGPGTRAVTAPDPAQTGQWGALFSTPITATHAVMLPTGKVMWWAYPNGFKSSNTAQAWLWDPATGNSNRVDPPLWRDPADGQLKPANIWCGGQALLADGRVLVLGGNLAYTGGTPNFRGLNKVYTFNPFNETWTEQPDMPHGRWYPSLKLLPDGRVLIQGGFDENGQGSSDPDIEIFAPSPNINGVGSLTKIGTRGGAGNPPDGELYPRQFVMPSGRTFIAGPDPSDTWFANAIGPSNAFTWTDVVNLPESHVWGTSVQVPGAPTKVMVTGGKNWSTGPTLNKSVIFDETAPGLGWQTGPSLNVPRAHHNTVLLPDGGMLALGGGPGQRSPEGLWAFDEDQKQAEIYDSGTSSWRLGSSQTEGRAYHSTAVLLPDGRIVEAGSTDYFATPGRDTAEIYSPPYLFKGARPAIASAPQSVNWGDDFGVGSTSGGLSRAVLVAPAATTHGNDMNERYVPLQTKDNLAGQGLNVFAPATSALAQPGYYMLFLLNQSDVPSVAKWIRLDPAAPDRPVLNPAPPDAPPVAVADSATVAEDSGATAINVLGNDTDIDGGPKFIQSASNPPHGTVSITGGGSSLTYTPDANYCGPDSFTYTLNGGSSATVSISVGCVDDPPVAHNDAATVNQNAGAKAINVLANDTDIDGGPKMIVSVSNPPRGTATVTSGGLLLTYKPDRDKCGPDSFTYTLNGGSSATVAVTVKKKNSRCRTVAASRKAKKVKKVKKPRKLRAGVSSLASLGW